jgi:LacI family transcriptional regulator
MAVTIKDLAKAVNLSITTVSRALDGYDDVAESTRERVIHTAHEMGYIPNRAARQLRRQRTDTIGYILPSKSPRFADPFFSDFIAGLGDAAGDHNFDLLISTASPGEKGESELYRRWVNSRKVDGFILNRLRIVDWRVQFLAESRVPFVSLEKSQDPVNYPCVTVNSRKGFRTLVRHILDLGHQRIAFIGASLDLVISNDRFAGYLDALGEADIPIDQSLIIQTDLFRQSGFEAAKNLLSLSQPPNAIVCANDLVAMGVLEAAKDLGLRVGTDLLVAGFDNIEESAHSQPPLTTLSQPVYEIARKLVDMLIDLINGNPIEDPCVPLEPELVLRSSTTGMVRVSN